MSPYQQDVIDTTLQEFDVQAAKGIPSIAAQAVGKGVLGGGREGVMRAEYQTASDRNRAALQAQLLQQGFGQAQQAAQQQYLNQMNLAQISPQLAGQQISALGALGTQQQAQTQAGLDAATAAAREAQFEPFTRLGLVGQQLAQVQPGAFPTQTVGYQAPAAPASPLSTALGVGTGIASIGSKLGLFG